jgi:methylated-DNA-[protein]-cysteine S-methyltransferase
MKHHPHTVCTYLQSPLGPMLAAASPMGLSGLWFIGQKHFPQTQWREAAHPVFGATQAWLDAYFAGQCESAPALDLSGGSAFQQAVWQRLLGIAKGERCSYGDLAQAIGKPSAARAVGAAVGRNPISLIVPCHRVVGAGGALTGYAGGLHRKTALLEIEHKLEPKP